MLRKHKGDELTRQVDAEPSPRIRRDSVQPVNRVNSQFFESEEEIDLRELFFVLQKWKYFIVLAMLLGLTAVYVFILVSNERFYVTEMAIELNFPGIEKHENPDGSSFEKGQVISPSILSKVEIPSPPEKTFNISESTPVGYNRITIEGVVPEFIRQKVDNARKKNELFPFYPNRFLLTFTTDDDTFIPDKEKANILTSIVKEYQMKFKSRYIDERLIFSGFSEERIVKNDYLDLIGIVDERIDNAIEYIDTNLKDAESFRSATRHISFGEIRGEFLLLKNVRIGEIRAIIEDSFLTKNPKVFVIQLRHRVKSLRMERERIKSRATVARKLLADLYASRSNVALTSKNTTSVNVEPTFIEKLRAEDNVSYLIKEILKYEAQVSDMDVELKKAKETLNGFQSGRRINSVSQQDRKRVEDYLRDDVINRYNELVRILMDLISEYRSIKFLNAVKIIQKPLHYEHNSHEITLKLVSVTVLISLMVSVLLVFAIEYFRKQDGEGSVRTD